MWPITIRCCAPTAGCEGQKAEPRECRSRLTTNIHQVIFRFFRFRTECLNSMPGVVLQKYAVYRGIRKFCSVFGKIRMLASICVALCVQFTA